MDAPGIVEDALEDETVATDVDLGGDDHLYVTPTRTLIYRSEGILSDESVESYDHEAERLSVSEGRRKATVTLTYPIDGTEEFTIPAASAEAAIPGILAGVLNANGVLDPGESVLETFRFSELTLVVTSERLVKHIGSAVWDVEFEEFRYEDVTGLSEESGSVATQIVLDVGGRTERIKTPNDRAPEVVQRLEDALRAYHDLGEREDLAAALSSGESGDGDAAEAAADEDPGGTMTFEDGVDPLDAGDTTNASVDGLDELGDGDASAGSGGGTASGDGGTEAASASADSGAGSSAGSSGGSSAGSSGGSTAGSSGGSTVGSSGESTASAGGASTTGGASGNATASSGAETTERDDADAASAASRSDAGTSSDRDASAGSDADSATTDDASETEGESDAFESTGFESAADSAPGLEAQLEELRDAVEQQNELLARQQETIEQLVEELRRGR